MTAASGPVSLPQKYLKDTLANCAAVRTWLGVATVQLALARMYDDALPPPASGDSHTLAELTTYRPFIMVWTEPEGGYRFEMDASGSQTEFHDSGQLWAEFEQDVDPLIADDPSEIHVQLRNSLGAMIAAVKLLAGTAGYLTITGGTLNGPYRSHPDERATQGDYIAGLLTVQWEGLG